MNKETKLPAMDSTCKMVLGHNEEYDYDFYRMPCRVIKLNPEEFINKSDNKKPYYKATVQFATRKNKLKTATAITYNVDYLDEIEDAVGTDIELLLESQKDMTEDSDTKGTWFLKLSHLVFGDLLEDEDFIPESEMTSDDNVKEVAEEPQA